MLEIKNCVTPSAEQYNVVIKGMRNAYKGQDKSDSEHCTGKTIEEGAVKYCLVCEKTCTPECNCFILGENDEKLLLNLCRAGDPSHRKVLRQLPVIMEIKAPLYWWKQMDQYKVGTVTNSESTMHTLTKYPFRKEDFSVKHFLDIDGEEINWLICTEYEDSDLWFEGMENHGYCFSPEEYFQEIFINLLNSLRYFYLKTKDQKYWYAINELLPQSYYQTRTWSANYEVLLTIIKQRTGHQLSEWKTLIDYLLENVPYLKDLEKWLYENND